MSQSTTAGGRSIRKFRAIGRRKPALAASSEPGGPPGARLVDRLLLRNVAVYVGHYGIRFLFPLILTPFLAHVLGKDRFAEFAIINSCIWTSQVFMEFGYYLYGVSKTAAAGDDRAALRQVVSEIVTSKLLLSPFAAAVYLGLTAWTGVLMQDPAATLLGLVSALGYGASFAWYFQGRQRGMFAVLSEAVPQLVQLGLMLSLIRSPNQLWLVFVVQAIPPVVALSVAVREIAREKLLSFAPRLVVLRSLKEASPYFFERLCYATYTSIMPSLIVLLATKSAVADYSVGDRFGTILVGLTGPLTQATMPRVARAVSEPGGGWRLSFGLVGFIVAVTVILAAVLAWGAGFIVDRLFSDDFAAAAMVARVFCATACCSAFGFAVANFVLIPRNQARVMFWSSGTALVLGLIAQFALVPAWGALGAALGRLVSEATVALVLVVAAVRLYRARRALPAAEQGGAG